MGDTDAKSNGALRCARAPAAPALSAIPSLLPPSLAHSAHLNALNALNASNASCSMLSLHQRLGPNIGPSMPSMPSTFQAFPSWAPGPPRRLQLRHLCRCRRARLCHCFRSLLQLLVQSPQSLPSLQWHIRCQLLVRR